MAKRFYDIFPPEKEFVLEKKEVKEVFEKEKGFAFKKPKIKIKRVLSFNKIFSLVFAFLIIFGAFALSFKLSIVKLNLWPKTDLFSSEYQIKVSLNANEINAQEKVIPGFLFEEEKELWQEFPVEHTELKEEKAKGKIRVFNEDKKPLSLREETRFLSENNKIFLAPKPIYIPSNSYVDVEVVALEAGEEYNIGPANFSVPGLQGSARYFTTYGKSFEPMQGGSKKEIKKLTAEEFEKAKSSLIEKTKDLIKSSLKKKAKNYFLFDEAIDFEVKEIFSPAVIDSEIDKFDISVKMKGKAIAFKNSDLENILKEILNSEVSSSKNLFLNTLNIESSFQSSDFSSNEIILNSKISLKTYSKFDEDLIKTQAINKDKEGIKNDILQNFPEILKVEVKFYPFWIKRAPNDLKRIKLYFKVD